MTAPALDPVGLPDGSPTGLAAVKAYLGIGPADTTDDSELDDVIAAVEDVVRALPIADTARGLTEWPARISRGATMLAGRLQRRRNTPDGVSAFAELGAVYVSRNDPDVAQLLQLGTHRRPAVG